MTKHPVIDGLKLGMALQFGGMGPICLLLFQLSSLLPLKTVLGGVWAVTFVDGIYIAISVLGIMQLIRQVKEFSDIYKKIVGVIIALIGLSFCLMVFSQDDNNYISQFAWTPDNTFITLFILNLLNPVAIVCYTGVFTAKVISTKLSHKNLVLFAFGTLLSTPIFLSAVVIIGHLGASFFPAFIISTLNLMIGLALIYWGIIHIFPSLSLRRHIVRFKQTVQKFLKKDS